MRCVIALSLLATACGRIGYGAVDGGASDGHLVDAADSAPAMLTSMDLTFFGWADNTPPGRAIAYPGLHAQAGGTGTFADPITFASDPAEFAPGTVLYVPLIEKYVIMEDECVPCETDWSAGRAHINVWMNSSAANPTQLAACESSWSRTSTDVETQPPDGRPVTTTPLFDPTTGTCRTTP